MKNGKEFQGWVILELMGHRMLGGWAKTPGGPGVLGLMVRIDIFDGDQTTTQYYGGTAIYCLTPTTEDLARAAAVGFNGPSACMVSHETVHSYSLPRLDELRFGPTFRRRIENCLENNNILSTGDLLSCSATFLLGFNNFGPGCLEDLIQALALHGLGLDVDDIPF